MGKYLGLDLGSNSMGWAIIDTNRNSIIDCGVRIFQKDRISSKRKIKNAKNFESQFDTITRLKNNFQTKPFLFVLTFINILTFMLTIIDFKNWQFWLNISLTALLTTLTIFHQDKKAE